MERTAAETAARRVGLITLPLGLGLLAAPRRVAALVGGQEAVLRMIAVGDLLLVPGLVAGRRRSSWMAARVALNLVIAGYCLARGRRGRTGTRVAAAAMLLASAADARTIGELRRQGTRNTSP